MLKSNSPFKAALKYLIYTFLGIAILATGFTAYLIWFQPAFHFPKPTGKHAVGVKTYHWVDKSRKETFENNPEHPNRELMVNIWYPSSGKLLKKPATPIAPYLVHHLKKTFESSVIIGQIPEHPGRPRAVIGMKKRIINNK